MYYNIRGYRLKEQIYGNGFFYSLALKNTDTCYKDISSTPDDLYPVFTVQYRLMRNHISYQSVLLSLSACHLDNNESPISLTNLFTAYYYEFTIVLTTNSCETLELKAFSNNREFRGML